MVTAQSINAGIINLPSVAKSSQINTAPIIISITSSHYLLDGQQYNSMKEILLALNNVANSRTRLISVAADKNIKYDYFLNKI
jgi:biopolymer transport protein ExbD